jgi:hypothetical protein
MLTHGEALAAFQNDQRGSAFVQTLILVSVLALGTVGAVKSLSGQINRSAECAGQRIVNFDLGVGGCPGAQGEAGTAAFLPIRPAAPEATGPAPTATGGIAPLPPGSSDANGSEAGGPVASAADVGAGAGKVPFGEALAGRDPRPEDLDLARISADVYEQTGEGLNGYRLLTDGELNALGINRSTLEDPATGFRAAVYVKDGQYVVAFAGTDPTQLGDLAADADQGLGFDSPQYEMARSLGLRLTEQLGDNVVFTGHSLGGGLASHAALSTGGTAVTFNAAGLHDETIRSAGLDPEKARRAAENGQIRAFRNHNDPLTGAQEGELPIGVGIGLPTVPVSSPLPDAVGNPIVVSGEGHNIGPLIEGLERDLAGNR